MVYSYSPRCEGGETEGLLDARNSETEKHKETLFKKRKKEANETSYTDALGLMQWENGAKMVQPTLLLS